MKLDSAIASDVSPEDERLELFDISQLGPVLREFIRKSPTVARIRERALRILKSLEDAQFSTGAADQMVLRARAGIHAKRSKKSK